MARILSLAARLAYQAGQTDEVFVALIEIEHASLVEPIRLSSDPTTVFSYEPLRFGTVHQGHNYDWVLPSLVLPDDEEDEPPKTRLSIENVSNHIVELVCSIADPLEITLKLVMASTPDHVEFRFMKLRSTRAPYDASTVSLEFSGVPILETAFPYHRMTKTRFPGLHP